MATLSPADERAADRHLEGCPACRALVADLRTRARGRLHARSAAAAGRSARAHPGAADQRAGAAWPPPRLAEHASGVECVAGRGRGAGAGDDCRRDAAAAVGRGPDGDGAGPGARWRGARGLRGGGSPGRRSSITTAPSRGSSRSPGPTAASSTRRWPPCSRRTCRSSIRRSTRAGRRSRPQPASSRAQDGLFEAMRTKVALLQQTVELINEMRKGNQAEAGRLMQDLSR